VLGGVVGFSLQIAAENAKTVAFYHSSNRLDIRYYGSLTGANRSSQNCFSFSNAFRSSGVTF
jgi:hypothetical protein